MTDDIFPLKEIQIVELIMLKLKHTPQINLKGYTGFLKLFTFRISRLLLQISKGHVIW